MNKKILGGLILLLIIVGCAPERVSGLCSVVDDNIHESVLNVEVDVQFSVNKGDLIANATYTNCMNEPVFFYPGDIGLDFENSYQYFYVGKLELLNVTDRYVSNIEFTKPSVRTDYQRKLASGEISKIKVRSGQSATGTFNLSKRYAVESGLYIVEFGITSDEFLTESVNNSNTLTRIISPTYLIDIDISKNEVLYVKTLE